MQRISTRKKEREILILKPFYWLYNWLAIPFMLIAGLFYALSLGIFRLCEFLFYNTSLYECTPKPVIMLYRAMMCYYCFFGPAATKEELINDVLQETEND